MKSLIIFFLLVLTTGIIRAQNERLAVKNIAEKFEKSYNKSDYDSVFAMFSTEMQTALPADKTKEFLAGIKTQAGQIVNREFVRYENTTYASYKTKFEQAFFLVNISVDNKSKINGLLVKPYKPDNLRTMLRNKSKLLLPFSGEWNVTWGGDTKELNYHVESESQKNAFDFLILDKTGKSYKTDGKINEDYFAFGKEITAPCSGKIVLVVDGVKDNAVGETNSFNVGGNTIIFKTINNEYLVFCHLKHQSIKVKEGQLVKQGQLLGLCGNSGHSSEPHLHFHLQNVEDMNYATGVKCYFDKLVVNGQLKSDYSPIKGDIIISN